MNIGTIMGDCMGIRLYSNPGSGVSFSSTYIGDPIWTPKCYNPLRGTPKAPLLLGSPQPETLNKP